MNTGRRFPGTVTATTWRATPVICLLFSVIVTCGCGDDAPPASLPSPASFGASSPDAAATDGAGAPDMPEGSSDAAREATPPIAACPWVAAPRVLRLPNDEVTGTLRGASRNQTTTCTTPTGGPEAVYTLVIERETFVDLEVASALHTVIAIRRVCDDSSTEVACNDTSLDDPTGTSDAGARDANTDSAPAGGPDGHLRTSLAPGAYVVIVDEVDPLGGGGDFSLRLQSSSPPQQASCSSALKVSDGTNLPAESLGFALPATAICAGTEPGPALFYSLDVPAGHRARVRAVAIAGEVSWTPKLSLAAGCDGSACLAAETASSVGGSEVTWTNAGSQAQTIVAAVSATSPVRRGQFRLQASVGAALENTTCEGARALTDGLVLKSQDARAGATDLPASCSPAGSTLFYSVRLLGQETLSLEVINDTLKRDDGRLIFSIRDSCSVPRCQTLLVRNLPGVLPFTNTSKEAKSFIVQITARGPSQSRGFDLKASLILPPAEMFIGRNDILATSERGGSATFTVVLKSPPRSPTTIPLKSLTPGEAMVEPAALTFDAENWHRPQTVTIKGVDDDRRDGRQPFTISVEPAMSADPRYAGFDGEDVTGTNQDDEPNVAIDAPTILHTSESGATGTFRVALTQAPAAPVRIAVANNDATEATVTPTELSFDASNWQTAQTVTVTGVDDDERDGPALYQVRVGPTTTSDPRYQDLQTVAVTARNLDDEFAAIAAAPVAIPSSCWLTGRTDLAVDRGGTLYVVYACHKLDPSRNSRSDGTYVVTSHDGGRSYSSPLALTPDFEPQQIVGGAAGFAAVLVDNGGPQMRVLRTHDGGRTWESSHVANDRFPISLVWAGPRLTAVAVDGDETLHISTSVDAGKSWISHAHAGESGELRIDDDGTTWLFSRHGRLRRSTDGGATFDPGIALPYRTTPRIAWGRRRFFFLENGDTEQLRMATRSDPRTALTPTVVGRPRHSIPDIAITPDDGLVFLATVNGEAGHVVGHELRWIPSGSTTQGPPVVVPGGLGPVPLSDRAAALLNVHHEETHRIAVSVFLAP